LPIISINKFNILVAVALLSFQAAYSNKIDRRVHSPNGNISVELQLVKGTPIYNIYFKDKPVITGNRLGLIRKDADFSTNLRLGSVSPIEKVEDNYKLLNGKRKECRYRANRKVFHFLNIDGKKVDLIYQVSNDGIAFRYFFPEKSAGIKYITNELTCFNFAENTIAWIQPIAPAKSGWNSSNPSFEEYYYQCNVTELPNRKPGWTIPALFKSGKFWISITETAPDHDYCGGRLVHDTLSTVLKIGFPQQAEVHSGSALNPESKLPWYTPWRIITIGDNLSTISESTLGTDLAKPCVLDDIAFIKPGRSAWSWVLLKDDSTIYPVQKKFIDYASEMGWEYCLIDADWDRKIGYEKIADLCRYAKSKNIGITVWYNSAGDWNTTPYTPRDKMLTKESREKEFKILKEIGVKSVKVDFFGGEGQSVMSYYQDILTDAARYGFMVDFHGCTYPRGLHRTYPNLITMEGIRGFEFVTFEQANADSEISHSTIIPFTRNLFDPMDFTPVCFSEVPNIERKTTNSFELALSVLFQSGIQHFAEVPAGLAKVPVEVKDILSKIPVTWDETKFIEGYPGEYAVLARRKENVWYIAGINGKKTDKKLELDISFIDKMNEGLLISCGENNRSFKIENRDFDTSQPLKIILNGNDGFLFRINIK
jgi:hypothetical protein